MGINPIDFNEIISLYNGTLFSYLPFKWLNWFLKYSAEKRLRQLVHLGCIESLSHSTASLGRNLTVHPVPIPCHELGATQQARQPRAPSSLALGTSRMGLLLWPSVRHSALLVKQNQPPLLLKFPLKTSTATEGFCKTRTDKCFILWPATSCECKFTTDGNIETVVHYLPISLQDFITNSWVSSASYWGRRGFEQKMGVEITMLRTLIN